MNDNYEITVYLKGGGSLTVPVKGIAVNRDQLTNRLLSIEVNAPEENHGDTLLYLDNTEVAAITSRPIPRDMRFLEEEAREALVKALLS